MCTFFHDDQLYLNGLDAYTLCTVHEQDSVVAKHKRTNYTYAIVHMLYSTKNDTSIHCLLATHEYVVKWSNYTSTPAIVKLN